MSPAIDITPEQRKTILALLRQHLPQVLVWAYGSRVKWTARPNSDFDLVAFTKPEHAGQFSALKEAFESSSLPFRVDLLAWNDLPENFHRNIKKEYVVFQEPEREIKGQGMSGDWREASLGDVVEINPDVVDKAWPFTHIRYIDISSVGEGMILEPPEQVPLSNAPSRAKRIVRQGDTVLSTVRPNRRSMFFVSKPEDDWVVSTGFAVLRPKPEKIDPRYLYACVFHKRFTDYLVSVEKGAAYPAVLPEDIAEVPIPLPPLTEQRAIAHILGTLDDKIELNRRMNETLEAMAQAIFKSWFIDFDPVHAKSKGRDHGLPKEIADLFPDSFQDSELGKVPAGWSVGATQDLADVSSGKRPDVRYPEVSEEARVPLWGGNGPMAFVPEALINYPVLLTGRVGTLGSVFRITSPCWPSDNTLFLKANNLYALEYLFLHLKRIDFNSLNRGSTQPLLTQTDLKLQPVLLPPTAILESFHSVVNELYKRMDSSEHESHALAATRNALLPKLLSGEVKPMGIEKAAERA
ncbi:MAG: restriction endonuclease subunit S [Elusimicrobia bacterium]|nr:restriction endonuclease subunit S [Elusimicrobiota bacterium]